MFRVQTPDFQARVLNIAGVARGRCPKRLIVPTFPATFFLRVYKWLHFCLHSFNDLFAF